MSQVPVTPKDAAHPRCAHIATKSDFTRGSQRLTPDDPGLGSTAIWWCIRTGTSLGPDTGPCGRAVCDPTRPCYRPDTRASVT